jgi:hypothetical protein
MCLARSPRLNLWRILCLYAPLRFSVGWFLPEYLGLSISMISYAATMISFLYQPVSGAFVRRFDFGGLYLWFCLSVGSLFVLPPSLPERTLKSGAKC